MNESGNETTQSECSEQPGILPATEVHGIQWWNAPWFETWLKLAAG